MHRKTGYPNIPVHLAAYVHPHVPSVTYNMRRLYVLCRGNEDFIRSLVAYTPFEYVSDHLLIEMGDYSGRRYPSSEEYWPFLDCSFMVQVSYKGRTGLYYIFQYENEEYAIFAGRELWGYPKSYADIFFRHKDGLFSGRVTKRGREIVRISGRQVALLARSHEIPAGPTFNLHTVPNADGPGIYSQRIIERDTAGGFELISEEHLEATVSVESVLGNPLEALEPIEVIGAGLQVGHYTMDQRTGWGKVLATIV